MRKAVLMMAVLGIAGSVQAEEIKIYERNQFGVPSVVPSQVIEVNRGSYIDSYKVYNTSPFGLKEFQPSQTIEVQHNRIQEQWDREREIRKAIDSESDWNRFRR